MKTLMTIGGCFALASSASAAVVYDWETASVGDIPGNDNWVKDALLTGAVTTTVVTGMSGNVAEPNTGLYHRTNDANFSYSSLASATTINMSVVTTAINNTTLSWMGLHNSTTGESFRFGKRDANDWGFRTTNQTVTDLGETGAAALTATRYTYRASVEIDVAANTLDFTVENISLGTSILLADDQAIGEVMDWAGFDGLYLRSGAGNTVDNFTLSAVPEPSSAALLGLGGLALILRRRK